MNPSVAVVLPLTAVEALERCAQGIEYELGGVISNHNLTAGSLDATFGLLHSERISCQCVALDSSHTSVRIVSRALVGTTPRMQSDYVTRLAAYLRS